jgi:hypothetical protein
MTDTGKEKQDEDGATGSRTLDEIEADESVPSSRPDSDVPSPDEGPDRNGAESEGPDSADF